MTFKVGDIVKRTSAGGGCSRVPIGAPVVVLGHMHDLLVVGEVVTERRLGALFPSRFELYKKEIEYNEDEWI